MKGLVLAAAAALTLAACGSSPLERGVTGGATGAVVGVAAAAITGGASLGVGALIGGGAGAAAGALTDCTQLGSCQGPF
jgi:hypothetical protein